MSEVSSSKDVVYPSVEWALLQGERCRNYGPEHARVENENVIVILADEVVRLHELLRICEAKSIRPDETPDRIEHLEFVLRGFYWDQVDYIKRNHLSGMDNHWMRATRIALGIRPDDPMPSEETAAPLVPERCQGDKHPPHAIKSVTTDAGMVYACERCSHHWFRKYGDGETPACACQVDQRTGALIGGPCPACSPLKASEPNYNVPPWHLSKRVPGCHCDGCRILNGGG